MKPPLLRFTSLFALLFRLLRSNVFALPFSHASHSVVESAFKNDGTFVHRLVKRASEGGVHVDSLFWIEIVVIIILVILSGILAGLTLGLMSLDETQLHVLSTSGTPKQKLYASRIRPIRSNGHLLLVTLLLANVIINETLPIIADAALGGGVIAVVVSTVLIVIFSEIVPQSVCSRYGLAIGAWFAWPVRILIWVLFVVAWPIAKLLDKVLGPHHGVIYRRAELKELINLHSSNLTHGGDLNIDTVTIMRGALDLQEKAVRDAMTPIADVFMLDLEGILDRKTLETITRMGHSRVPVFEWTEVPIHDLDEQKPVVESSMGKGQDEKTETLEKTKKFKKIIGVLLVKNLIMLDPDDNIPVRQVAINTLPSVKEWMPLFDILNTFQEGRSHMAVVLPSERPPGRRTQAEEDAEEEEGSNKSESPRHSRSRTNSHSSNTATENPSSALQLEAIEEMVSEDMFVDPEELIEKGLNFEPLGIITLEDVLEELIQEEIYDETDRRVGLAVPLGQGTRVILASPPEKKDSTGKDAPPRSSTLPSSTMPPTSPSARARDLNRSASEGMFMDEYSERRSRSESPNRGRRQGRLQPAWMTPFARKSQDQRKPEAEADGEKTSAPASPGKQLVDSPKSASKPLADVKDSVKSVRVLEPNPSSPSLLKLATPTPSTPSTTSISEKKLSDPPEKVIAAIIPGSPAAAGSPLSPPPMVRSASRNRFKAPQLDAPGLLGRNKLGNSVEGSPASRGRTIDLPAAKASDATTSEVKMESKTDTKE